MNEGDSRLLTQDGAYPSKSKVRDISDDFSPNQNRSNQYAEPLLKPREKTYTSSNKKGSPQKELSHTHSTKELKTLQEYQALTVMKSP